MAADPWQEPPLECDIVMKGGITSGVVYPGVVGRLARRYRYRSIGGASAGAMAAAVTAAAEYGRAGGGFARLQEVPRQLASTVDGEPFILTLFQPEPTTRRLFDTALAFQRSGRLRGVATALRSFWWFPLLALALVVPVVVLAGFDVVSWWVAVAVLAIAPWLLVLGIVRDVSSALKHVAENDFGLCRLGPESGPGALTPWLHGVIQYVAGRSSSLGEQAGPPLTFGDLWGIPPLRGDESGKELEERHALLRVLGWDHAARAVNLEVITTNLTYSRPLRLPIARDRWRDSSEDGGLLFDPEEWRRFFPEDVVAHMEASSTKPKKDVSALLAEHAPGRTFLYFGGGADLPVLVAARMSLSFPFLISTVPLWQIQYGRDGNHRLHRLAFSDGGISSNFPVHFFDSPLPRRPTFAVNLAGFELDEAPDLADPTQCVEDPIGVTGRAREPVKQLGTMLDLVVAVKDAFQNWRDTAQARMPGFRERVIHVKLADTEGGLNLAMSEEQVERLIARGDHAGTRLITLFSGSEDEPPQETEHWNDHRYARFRILMSVTERFLQGIEQGYSAPPDGVSVPYDERIAQGLGPPYRMSHAQLEAARSALGHYLELAQTPETLDDDDVPRPRAIARITPHL
jgi:predicted acylesterase/phospholipase RssA